LADRWIYSTLRGHISKPTVIQTIFKFELLCYFLIEYFAMLFLAIEGRW